MEDFVGWVYVAVQGSGAHWPVGSCCGMEEVKTGLPEKEKLEGMANWSIG